MKKIILMAALFLSFESEGAIVIGQSPYNVQSGETDYTNAFRRAVQAAVTSGQKIAVPKGQFIISDLITVNYLGSVSDSLGAFIEGDNKMGTEIKFRGKNKTAFSFGGSAHPAGSGLKNLTITADSSGSTALLVSSANFCRFENLKINYFKVGLDLHVNSSGEQTEGNMFEDLFLNNNEVGIFIRSEYPGNPDEGSFRYNKFNHVSIDVYSNQTGIKHESGILYHSDFEFNFTTHGSGATMIEANAVARMNQGTIFLETQQSSVPLIKGDGIFWFKGNFIRTDESNIENITSASEAGLNVFVCDNYPFAIPENIRNDNLIPKTIVGSCAISATTSSSAWNSCATSLNFSKALMGRLYISVDAQEYQYDPTAVLDLHWHTSGDTIVTVSKFNGYEQGRHNWVFAEIERSTNKVFVRGSLHKNAKLTWAFHGIVR